MGDPFILYHLTEAPFSPLPIFYADYFPKLIFLLRLLYNPRVLKSIVHNYQATVRLGCCQYYSIEDYYFHGVAKLYIQSNS